ncbi:uncharacterized protein LOC121177196 isoform X2 [Toxotes jaculatrix]|uniref:uncharacterized protein LOC121177196 isoform X2 n=1 Tax=Toxotes jaculatrix TaxID=941984 RepID=UPI001B3AA37E|nr:uncharacterized protein LOC121177196 isoform X2 [Toxotes jaculatrix]
MNSREGNMSRPRRPVLPPLSTRTLHHPSFLPLYVAAGFAHTDAACNSQTAHPIIPTAFFYTDPTMSRGRRIPNRVSDLGVFDRLQLNTPPPVMSACLAPPNRRDPFRSGPHPIRDLGSPEWRMNPIHLPVQPSRTIVQLTQEEDQAITNLLKLHHQGARQGDDTLTAAQMDFSSVVEPPVDFNPCLFLSHSKSMDPTSAEDVYKPLCCDVQYPRKAGLLQQGRGWSDMELEAADTLLSCFSLTEEDRIWVQCHQKSAVMLPDHVPYQNKDLPINTETQQESEALPTLKASHSTQNDISNTRFSCVSENGEPGWRDFRSAEDRGVSGDFSKVRERMLSDSEGDAVHVLLSLGDMGTLDILH